MPRIKRIITLAAISAATAASPSAIAGAAPIGGFGSGSGSISNADWVAAQRAATQTSASLDRFALIGVHTITPAAMAVVSRNSDPEGFQFGDAAIGAGVMAGLVLVGAAGAIGVRRRAQVRHP
ncbi:MAG: hypothetical protein JO262_12705 [Solirubrobacterales bacterium]|nr:hypothetical protein [Solirubrobacterales bacterium]MBV9942982.1 hypothetical protein [Solirubrobacterales bacterium]